LITHKEKKIHQYASLIEEKNIKINQLRKDLHKRDEFIMAISKRNLLVKKLENLSFQEFQDKLFLKLEDDDLVLVKNPSIVSERVADELRGKVKIIITENPPSGDEREFLFLKKEGIIISETENFALADKEALEEHLKARNLLKKVLLDYKSERRNAQTPDN
jgi:predicted RNase H-like nuclease (RuvC/YqgF family)